MADTFNLGYQMPASPFITGRPSMTTDTQWQNYQGPATPAVTWANQTGLSYGQYPGIGQSNNSNTYAASNGSNTGGGGGGVDIKSLLDKQMAENADKEAKQQAAWDEEKKYMLGLPNQYKNDPTTIGTQKLVRDLLANPEALNDGTVNRIRNQNANQVQAQQDNQFRQGMGTLAAGGATSARSINALRERLGRNAMATNQTQNTSLEVQRANQRNQDIMNAANLGRTQATTDIGIPMQVGQSIMANQPQYKPNDYSGLLALGQQQNANQQNNQQQQNGNYGAGVNPNNPFANTQSPTGFAGGRYTDAKGTNSTNAGFGMSNMNNPGYTATPGFAGDQTFSRFGSMTR